jgi:hypothetical protein
MVSALLRIFIGVVPVVIGLGAVALVISFFRYIWQMRGGDKIIVYKIGLILEGNIPGGRDADEYIVSEELYDKIQSLMTEAGIFKH